ncbi:cytochrome oxidase assembly protein SHY1 [Ascoidea rubescens DSM 1968]|uniref:SURF1-like protein n=1 Tax=Ascoidea rubescens DSM 1968 TaxID=1344418 RepID=A0A1D2VEN4_9ASCO|nr:SURF1-domain-containing protein [Ascoidea rubescens DSM 1968]ODV60042.1 SURF1-domain-containing protein [Ascoidea rubescens DSM 1968]
MSLAIVCEELVRTYVTSNFDWKPIKTKNIDAMKGDTHEQKQKGQFGQRVVLSLLILMPIISFYLGTWQLKRLSWKTDLISKGEDRLTYPPVPLPKDIDQSITKDNEFRKFYVKGHFKNENEFFVGPRTRNGESGFMVFTPFERSDGGEPLLIERGWIAKDRVDPRSRSLRHLSLPEGEVTVVVLVREIEKKSSLVYDHDPSSRLYYHPEIEDMARRTGCKPVYLQAAIDMKDKPLPPKQPEPEAKESKSSWALWGKKNTPENTPSKIEQQHQLEPDYEFAPREFIDAGVPIGRTLAVNVRNNHLQYLITWYSLSLISSVLLIVVLKNDKNLNPIQAKLKHAKRFQ